MNRSPFYRVKIVRRAAASVLALLSAFAAVADERPNIIFIMANDHAAHALSAYGSRINRTPNLDRLANEGMLFRHTFCTNSICAPSLKRELARLQRHYGDSLELGKELTAKSASHFGRRGSAIGPVQHPDFAWAKDVRITASAAGYDIIGQHQGFALHKTPQPITKRVTFRCKLKSLRKDGTRNGFIVFGPDNKPENLIKCGVFIGGEQIAILHGSFDRPLAQGVKKSIKFDRDKTFDVTVEVDLKSRRIVLSVDGNKISARIGKAWDHINFYGYAANQTATHFGPIEVKSEVYELATLALGDRIPAGAQASGELLLVSPAQISPKSIWVYDSVEYSVCADKHGRIQYIATSSSLVATPEGVFVGQPLSAVLKIKGAKRTYWRGWGYLMTLPSGWKARLDLGGEFQDREPVSTDRVGWLFKGTAAGYGS